MFVPQNIPSSSNILDDINGYVETSPLVNIFLLDANLISILFSIIGRHDKNTCSCLKFALLVCIPHTF